MVWKYTIHATRSVPAKNTVAFLSSPLRYEGNIAGVMFSISVYGIRDSALYVLLPGVLVKHKWDRVTSHLTL
jgi:hypothetical protein